MDRRKVTAFQSNWCCILHTADGAVHQPRAMPGEGRTLRAPQHIITLLPQRGAWARSEAENPRAPALRERRYELMLDETYDPSQRIAHYLEVVK